jgi:hypothetical protein
MGVAYTTGILSIMLGVILFFLKSRSRGEMEIKAGIFKGPIWFLLMIFGLFLMLLDPYIG